MSVFWESSKEKLNFLPSGREVDLTSNTSDVCSQSPRRQAHQRLNTPVLAQLWSAHSRRHPFAGQKLESASISPTRSSWVFQLETFPKVCKVCCVYSIQDCSRPNDSETSAKLWNFPLERFFSNVKKSSRRNPSICCARCFSIPIFSPLFSSITTRDILSEDCRDENSFLSSTSCFVYMHKNHWREDENSGCRRMRRKESERREEKKFDKHRGTCACYFEKQKKKWKSASHQLLFASLLPSASCSTLLFYHFSIFLSE